MFSDSDDFEYDNFEPPIKEDPAKETVEPDPDIFFLGDQCRICAEVRE